MGLVTVRPS